MEFFPESNMNINQARLLALALCETKPTDPVRKAHWIHAMRVLRDIVKQEIPAIDPDRWEHLCYGDED